MKIQRDEISTTTIQLSGYHDTVRIQTPNGAEYVIRYSATLQRLDILQDTMQAGALLVHPVASNRIQLSPERPDSA